MAPPPPGQPDPLITALTAILGPDAVVTDAGQRGSYETDWTRRFHGTARAVLLPSTPDDLARALALCSEAGAKVVPQGGNTGLVGGGVPRGGEVVLSTARLARIGHIDFEVGEVEVEAGVTLGALQARVRGEGFDFGVDLASRGSATIGGMVATNAGGTRVLRYGDMRRQVLGLGAVLPGGARIGRMAGPEKDNTGYDLPGLLAGSEGTLAVITRVRLRLVPMLRHRVAALVAFASTAAALAAATRLRRALPALESTEVFYAEGLSLVCDHAGLQLPFPRPHAVYLLVECAADDDPLPAIAAALERCDGILDSAAATGRAERDALWAYRERHTEAVNAAGVPVKLDVAVPQAEVVAFELALRALVATELTARLVLWGHLSEGNFHVNLLGLEPGEGRLADSIFRLVLAHHGSISSEHGLGVAKAPWLELARGPADVALMRRVKQAFDPGGIMNPGVIFPA